MGLATGTKLGPYEVLSPLGAGGMGEVYRAKDARLDREVAIKVVPERTARDEQALSRFRRETRALAALSHPNILMILDVGEHQGVSYAVMELLEGETLRQRLRGAGVDSRKALDIGAAVADGLAAAHARGIVHRDLKPENLFLTKDGVVKILDFGLARTDTPESTDRAAATVTAATQPGVVLGTVNYMSPEQVRGQKTDLRCDIFSLGCVLYEMLTGKPPFVRETSAETMTAILRQHPTLPSETDARVPAEIDPVVSKCLEKNAGDRFHSAHDLAFTLRSILAGSGVIPARKRPWLPWPVMAAVLALLAAALLVGAFMYRRELRLARHDARETINSLAVLPLENVSRDPEQEYFVDGMTEALISDLAKIGGLKVISRTSVMRYKATTKSLPEIARELNVDAVVEGSVLRVGERVRITAQLIYAATDKHLWAESYDRDLSDVLRLHSEVARTIAKEIKVTLTPQEQSKLAVARPVSPAAHEAYLRGRFHWQNRTRAGLLKAIEYYRRAIEFEPNYASAFAGIADAYTYLARQGHVSPKEAFPLANQAALKAVELDDGLAEAHGALAVIAFSFDWDWKATERELRRASDLNESYEEAHHQYSHLLMTLGRPDESLTESRRALELNPLDPILKVHVGWHYLMIRQYDQSIAQLKAVLDVDPEDYQALRYIGWAYTFRSLNTEAFTALEAAARPAPDNAQAMSALAAAYAAGGRGSDAKAILAELEGSRPQRFVSACDIAAVYAALKEVEIALEWLEKAYEERSPRMVELGLDPVFDPLRSDPRFADLVRRVGLPPLATLRGIDPPQSPLIKGGGGKIMLAVLPFENLSRDPEQDYFSDGLTEEMISQLSRLNPKKLGVIARTSAMHYKNTAKTIDAIGRELGVAYIVEGSVRRAGERVRITAQLIQVSDQTHLWAENYERDLKDIFALQSDVAERVAREIRVAVTPAEAARLTDDRPPNPEAHELYLRGRYHWHKRGRDGLEKASHYLQQAVEKDPGCAPAYAALADVYAVRAVWGLASPSEDHPRARAAALKALELDDRLPAPYATLGLVKREYDRDSNGAEQDFRRALQLDPNYATARQWYGELLSGLGRHEEAIAELETAVRLDPLAPIISFWLGRSLYHARRYDEAVQQLKNTVEMHPDFAPAFVDLGLVYAQLGRDTDALAALEKVNLLAEVEVHGGYIGWIYAKTGRQDEAQSVFRRLQELSSREYVDPAKIAMIYIGLGEKEEALTWLERAYELRGSYLISFLKVDPVWDPLRGGPHFKDLLRRMNFPD